MKERAPIWITCFGMGWGVAFLGVSALIDPTAHTLASNASILLSGIYALVLYASRRLWLPLFRGWRFAGAFLAGCFNAAAVETLFLAAGTALGAPDIAAAPNLFLDLLITMPWYIGLSLLFALAHSRARFPLWAVIVLGGIYEFGADGLLGGVMVPLVSGSAVDWPLTCLCLPTTAIWQFMLVYSSLVVPAALILNTRGDAPPAKPAGRWIWGMLPLVWLIPYALYLIGLLILMSGV